jgi:hypothetical protein
MTSTPVGHAEGNAQRAAEHDVDTAGAKHRSDHHHQLGK